MNRRNAVKSLATAAGALISLPTWMGCGTNDGPATHLTSFSTKEQELIAAVADTFVPTAGSGSIGALSMGVDKFIQKLLDDCYKDDVRNNTKYQLATLDSQAKRLHQKTFPQCSAPERQKLLLSFSSPTDKMRKDFFDLMRSETIRGFTTSQEVMQKYLGYKVAPGHYFGCVNV